MKQYKRNKFISDAQIGRMKQPDATQRKGSGRSAGQSGTGGNTTEVQKILRGGYIVRLLEFHK